MNLELLRDNETANGGILGRLYVDGQFFGYTLENAAAAIPAGIFSMFARFSPKFNSFKAAIDVPGRQYIMFHGGNTPGDSAGCPLVAKSMDADEGTIAGDLSGVLYERLKNDLEAGNVVITIRRATNWPVLLAIVGAAVYFFTR